MSVDNRHFVPGGMYVHRRQCGGWMLVLRVLQEPDSPTDFTRVDGLFGGGDLGSEVTVQTQFVYRINWNRVEL